MSNEENNANEVSDKPEEGIIEKVTDLAGDLLTGLPAPIRKNAFKAFAQLCTAIIEIPVAHLSGIAAEKRAETHARVKIINAGADQIADQMKMDPEYAQMAVKKFGQKIIREQINLDRISVNAARELQQLDEAADDNSESSTNEEISEDWLNSFEKEAANKNSDEMQMLFGKILAGEIHRPKTYSIRTMKIISQLDNRAATLFQTFCSLAVSLRAGNQIIDGRVVSLSGNAASNSLQGHGLSFGDLNILQEYGLIISDYNSYMDYSMCLAKNSRVGLPFIHQEKPHAFVLQEGKSVPDLKLHGVSLSNSGKELLSIVDVTPSSTYTSALIEFFNAKGLDMVEVGSTR